MKRVGAHFNVLGVRMVAVALWRMSRSQNDSEVHGPFRVANRKQMLDCFTRARKGIFFARCSSNNSFARQIAQRWVYRSGMHVCSERSICRKWGVFTSPKAKERRVSHAGQVNAFPLSSRVICETCTRSPVSETSANS